MSRDYRECATCAAKPGMPVLCDACLHNRKLVGELLADVAALRKTADYWKGANKLNFDAANKYEGNLAEARALLAWWMKYDETWVDFFSPAEETRAFLRRDEEER